MGTITVKDTLKKPVIQTDDVGVDVMQEVEFKEDNSQDVISDTSELSIPKHLTPGTPGYDSYFKELKFFEEPVSFIIGHSGDPNDETVVPVSVNCEAKLLERGKEYTLPRKFLNALIVRTGRIETVNYHDSKGLDQTKVVKTFSLKYPIQITHDANPISMKWFKWQCENA